MIERDAPQLALPDRKEVILTIMIMIIIIITIIIIIIIKDLNGINPLTPLVFSTVAIAMSFVAWQMSG